jgi:hypothetical protein
LRVGKAVQKSATRDAARRARNLLWRKRPRRPPNPARPGGACESCESHSCSSTILAVELRQVCKVFPKPTSLLSHNICQLSDHATITRT